MTNKFVKAGFAIAATASVAMLAGCPGGAPGTTTPTATPSGAAASATPTTPTTPASGAPASAAATALPTTSDTSDKATVKGFVEDDQGNRLDGVTVTATILDGGQSTFGNGTKELAVQTSLGTYVLNGCPTGVTLKIRATKSGMTTRTQTYVPLSNKQGDPSANQVDFAGTTVGAVTTQIYSLSDKPEVTSITPARGATGVAQDASLVLTFSEPVDKTSVQDNLAVGMSKTDTITLSVGDTVSPAYDANSEVTTGAAAGDDTPYTAAELFYDKAQLSFTWNADRTQVTVTPKEGFLWASDKSSDNVPSWAVVFDASIKDDDNNERTDAIFRLTETSVGKFGSYFKVAKDDVEPEVVSITALNASGGADDRILVKFSETMCIYPTSAALGAGETSIPDDGEAEHVLLVNGAADGDVKYFAIDITNDNNEGNAINFRSGNAINAHANCINYTNTDGPSSLYFDPNDASKKTVVLEFDGANSAFAIGDFIEVFVSNTVADPAGNTIPSDKDNASTTAS